jgi:hypothetical protein
VDQLLQAKQSLLLSTVLFGIEKLKKGGRLIYAACDV